MRQRSATTPEHTSQSFASWVEPECGFHRIQTTHHAPTIAISRERSTQCDSFVQRGDSAPSSAAVVLPATLRSSAAVGSIVSTRTIDVARS